MSETNTCRERLSKFCEGTGADIGFGGMRPIIDTAICIDRAKEKHEWPIHIFCDMGDLPFKDDTLDYLYSSHALEDARDPKAILCEWTRVIKPGGYLVLFLPDQQTYVAHCRATGQTENMGHVFQDFSLGFVKSRLPINLRVVHELFPVPNNPYSFDLVCQKD